MYAPFQIRKRKLEKADILELTVKHLRNLQKIQSGALSITTICYLVLGLASIGWPITISFYQQLFDLLTSDIFVRLGFTHGAIFTQNVPLIFYRIFHELRVC
jgi:hypothetical protein